MIILYIVAFLGMRIYLLRLNSSSLATEEYCFLAHRTTPSLIGPDLIKLTVWARAYREFCWQIYGPVSAATRVTDYDLEVKPTSLKVSPATYQVIFQEAAEAGSAPDIAQAGIPELTAWRDAGYLLPVDRCRGKYPEFNYISDRSWLDATWQNQTWGVPFEIGLILFFYNKVKLKELGWSERQIAALPEQIRNGEFTLDDVVKTVKPAIETGVIRPGFGYWPTVNKQDSFILNYMAYGGLLYDADQEKFVINQEALNSAYTFQQRLITEQVTPGVFAETDTGTWANHIIWNDTVINGGVLFFSSYNNDWSTWSAEYAADLGKLAQLSDKVGYALYPTGVSGRPGSVLWGHTGFYVITSEHASGRNHQDAACALIAQSVTPEISAFNSQTSAHQSVIQPQIIEQVLEKDSFSAETLYMLDYVWHPPIQQDHYHDLMMVLMIFLEKSETGQLSPPTAAALAVQQLQNELGDALVVK